MFSIGLITIMITRILDSFMFNLTMSLKTTTLCCVVTPTASTEDNFVSFELNLIIRDQRDIQISTHLVDIFENQLEKSI